jgi:hypothetical protein
MENLEKIALLSFRRRSVARELGIHSHEAGCRAQIESDRESRGYESRAHAFGVPQDDSGAYAASRYCRGDAPNSARKLRVKFDRSSNPTSSAMSVTGAAVAASLPAASHRRARNSH